MALWPGKKGDDEDEIPEGADPLEHLTSHLRNLGRMLNQANDQVTAYLLQRESAAGEGESDNGVLAMLGQKIDALADRIATSGSQATGEPGAEASDEKPAAPSFDSGMLDALVRPLQEVLGKIDAKLSAMAGQDAGDSETAVDPVLVQIRDTLNQQFAAMAEGIQYLQQRLDAGMQYLAEQLAPEQPDASTPATPAGMLDWQYALLGSDLAEISGLEIHRQQLLEGVLQGNEGACALVGQLLCFRSAMTDKMPPLLKDLGEAYYRWAPKTRPGSDPMETALAGWLKETMQDAGIANTIELVHPGERFDSTRHNAATRGVEITEVRGWIVLRDNGKVYTKAAVVVQ
ncbi:MAG: hypothetical protein V3R99_07610 [Thermoguttaceae bacterium]